MALQSLFNGLIPAILDSTDGTGDDATYELGTKFRSVKPGVIRRIRYYKSALETGSHIGKIWSSSGELLAQASFLNESSNGWQDAILLEPLRIQPNTIYVVSTNINQYYVDTPGGLTGVVNSGDLSTVADNNNGVFNVTPGLFPLQSFNNTNYFVDIAFERSEIEFKNLGILTPGDGFDTFDNVSTGELFRVSYIGNVDKFDGWLAFRPLYRDGSIGRELWVYPQINTAIFEYRIPSLMKQFNTEIIREWQLRRRQKYRYNPAPISPIDVRLEEITEWIDPV